MLVGARSYSPHNPREKGPLQDFRSLVLQASPLLGYGRWRSSSKLLEFHRQVRGWRAPSGRQCCTLLRVEGGARWACGFFPRRRFKYMVAGSNFCRPACSRETSNARVGGAVGRFQKDPPLVSCFLANEPLDVPVQQLDGRTRELPMWR